MRCIYCVVLLLSTAANTAWAATISDTFDDGSLAPLWVEEPDEDALIQESGGKLNFACSDEVGQWGRIRSSFAFTGDFDVSIDFEDFRVVTPCEQIAELRIGTADTMHQAYMGIGHDYGPAREYYCYVHSVGGWAWGEVSTTDTGGALRLIRLGSTVSGYYRAGESWMLAGTGNMESTGPLNVYLTAGYDYAEAEGCYVSFDNFRAVVPEPCSVALLAMAGLSALLRLWRRRSCVGSLPATLARAA